MERSPLVDVTLGAIHAQAVSVAAELRLADLLAGGSRTSDELAAATGTDPPSLRRLLRALTALGVLAQVEADRFEVGELGAHLRSDVPDSVRSFVMLAGLTEWWRSWGELASCVRTGEPGFDRLFGMPVFEHLSRHPEKAAMFGQAMAEITRDLAPDIAAGYDFSKFGTIVDVGGGDGTLLTHVLRAAPGVEAVLFDLPSGLESAQARLEAAGVAGRCRVVPGDFFTAVPDGADAYVMKAVIHDWDDERCVAILRNCRRAMAAGGRVLIIERVVPDIATADVAELLLVDLIMMTLTGGGRERTKAEYRELLEAAGLTLASVSEPVSAVGDRVIEGAAA